MLKNSFINGAFWNSIDKLFVQSWNIIIGIVLANILSPNDFGLIAMVSILMVFSQIILDSGMGTALIQKNTYNELDYSTVLVFNVLISLFLYLFLYFSAPFIAVFYDKSELTLIIRIISLGIIIQAFGVVHISLNVIDLNFKKNAKVNLITIFISGILSIILAFKGFGVWSLVFLYLSNILISTVLFWYLSSWKIKFKFNYYSFKSLFNYSYKLLLGGLYASLIKETYNVVIGKNYGVNTLGYYNKGKEYAEQSSGVIALIIQQVSFPIFAKIKNDEINRLYLFEKLIKMTSFIVFPMMLGFYVLAEPFVKTFFNEEWYPMIEILKLLCLSRILYPINFIMYGFFNALGESSVYLKLELLLFPIIFLVFYFVTPFGIKFLIISLILISLISFLLTVFAINKYHQLSVYKQIKNISLNLLNSILMSVSVFYLISYFNSNLVKLILGVIFGVLMYLILNITFKVKEIEDVAKILKEKSWKINP